MRHIYLVKVYAKYMPVIHTILECEDRLHGGLGIIKYRTLDIGRNSKSEEIWSIAVFGPKPIAKKVFRLFGYSCNDVKFEKE